MRRATLWGTLLALGAGLMLAQPASARTYRYSRGRYYGGSRYYGHRSYGSRTYYSSPRYYSSYYYDPAPYYYDDYYASDPYYYDDYYYRPRSSFSLGLGFSFGGHSHRRHRW
jgi:hypothetical protein